MDALVQKGVDPLRMSFVRAGNQTGESYQLKLRTKSARALTGGFAIGAIVGALFCALTVKVSITYGESLLTGVYASAGFGAAVGSWIGAIIGWIAGHRVPMYEAAMTSDESKADSILLGIVSADPTQKEAEQLEQFLKRQGASNVAKLDRTYATEAGL